MAVRKISLSPRRMRPDGPIQVVRKLTAFVAGQKLDIKFINILSGEFSLLAYCAVK